MNWYLAKIIYRIICGEGNHTAQFDEQLRLISAVDEEDALEKAKLVGIQEEETFYNDKKQLVQWKFIGLAELHSIHQMMDGAEVFSQIKETDNPDAYSSFIQNKSTLLHKKFSVNKLQIA